VAERQKQRNREREKERQKGRKAETQTETERERERERERAKGWSVANVKQNEPNAALASLNSLAWVQDPDTAQPLLCVAGSEHKHIKILDIDSGQVVHTLSGHGAAVNDLAVSPLSTTLLASAAEDSTIRIWNIDAKFQAAPCVALFAGEGHKAPILAIDFHPNGQWLLSGGIDHAICLWACGLVYYYRV
jgi:WD40 repeat protein